MTNKARRALVLCVVALGAACASLGAPPGGPEDEEPPRIVKVTPDSGQVRAPAKPVEFQFDEVISELPKGAQDLARLVLVSPTDGPPMVNWHRDRITVRQRRDWRPNTTYVITLLPGITDLLGNSRDSANVIVFTTGDSIAQTRLRGVAFDWTKNAFAPRAYVDAHPKGDTTVRYATEADSNGRFVLPFLPRGEYVVRAIIDANKSRGVDGREAWDTATVVLRDSGYVDVYAYPHDSAGPKITSVTVIDSVTIRVAFDKPFKADTTYVPTIEVRTSDSALVPIRGLVTAKALEDRRLAREKFRRDSMIAADTTKAGADARAKQRADSIERAAAIRDSLARDTTRRVPPPVSARPPLVSEVGVDLAQPLVPGVTYFVQAKATGILGREESSVRSFSRPKPPPATAPPAAAKRDTLTNDVQGNARDVKRDEVRNGSHRRRPDSR